MQFISTPATSAADCQRERERVWQLNEEEEDLCTQTELLPGRSLPSRRFEFARIKPNPISYKS